MIRNCAYDLGLSSITGGSKRGGGGGVDTSVERLLRESCRTNSSDIPPKKEKTSGEKRPSR